MKNFSFTSESVTEGHPDKVCDQLSDAILDELLAQDPNSRVAVESMITTGSVHISGEVTSNAYIDVQKTVRKVLKDIGYTDPDFGIDCNDAGIWVSIHGQSPDISQGVSEGVGMNHEQGAGDQGMMFGYACDETEELMPLPIMLAHKLSQRLAMIRKEGLLSGLGPDGKSQVTVEYIDDKAVRLSHVVIAQQHVEAVSEIELRELIMKEVIEPVCSDYIDENTNILINATGKFVIGGPEGDTGLTGRKIIVDTYGGMGRHGGGAFSGKDPSKVDRSAAYAARYIAKNIVASGLAKRCEVQLSYAIGVSEPTGIFIDTFGTGQIASDHLTELVKEHFPLKPADILDALDLRKPIYRKTAAYGHFGRDFSWEKIDKAEILKEKSTAFLQN